MNIVTSMTGKTVTDYTFKKEDTAVTMKARSTVQIDGKIIPVDPLLLFQCLITTVRGLGSDLDLETAFTYELVYISSSACRYRWIVKKSKQAADSRFYMVFNWT